MATLSDFKDRLAELLPYAEDNLADTMARESAIAASIYLYSKIRPLTAVVDYDGDGSTYQFDLPTDFYYETSRITKVECDQGSQLPEWVDSVYYTTYTDLDDDGDVVWVFHLYTTPSASVTVRMYYTTLHVVNNSRSTVPSGDFEAFCQLAAYHLASTLAGHYAKTYDPQFEAGLLNYRTKSDQFRSLATQFMTTFKLHMGMGLRNTVPAAARRGNLIRDYSIFRERL